MNTAGATPLPMPRRLGRALTATRESKPTFALVATALFVLALAIAHGFHELWRDEIHVWSVGKNATGLFDLLTGERRYDGHPFLWYTLLYLVSAVHRGVGALHAITVVLAGTSCFLWLRHSGFPRFLRLLFLTTQLFFFEYGVMCRGYTLGILLAFAFAARHGPQQLGFVTSGSLLALLSMTSAYGAMWSCALAIVLFTTGWKTISAGAGLPAVRIPAAWLAGLAIWVAGLTLTVATTIPPADLEYTPPWSITFGADVIRDIGGRIWAALFPYRSDGWPAYGHLGMTVPALTAWLPRLGLAIVVVCAAVFARRSWRTATALVVGMAMMGLFQQWKYLGGARHWGHFMIFLVLCAWLFRKETRGRRTMLVVDGLLTVIFVAQSVTAVRVLRMEKAEAFSGASDAAQFLRGRGWQDLPLFGSGDYAVTAVAGYLDRPFTSAERGETGRYVLYHNRAAIQTPASTVAVVAERLPPEQTVAILILNYDPNPLPALGGFSAELVHVTRPAVAQPDERFWVYRLQRQP